ncbi:MAG TPA: tripartite tricarboxylate transporter TctB family protein [Burkholderiales bacterium]|nr:tripartite tricarboxylate transporter TctB family protein [Burkholderiales bacterium]
MNRKIAPGELILALFFALLGGLWIAAAARMPLWQGFIPQSGFIPLWYGITLFGLAAAILAKLYLEKKPQHEEPVGKPLVVLAALAASIVGLDLIGFAPAVFLLLLVLFAAVERLPLLRSLAVAAAVTAVLFLIFRTWLRVPLPVGPLGI